MGVSISCSRCKKSSDKVEVRSRLIVSIAPVSTLELEIEHSMGSPVDLEQYLARATSDRTSRTLEYMGALCVSCFDYVMSKRVINSRASAEPDKPAPSSK